MWSMKVCLSLVFLPEATKERVEKTEPISKHYQTNPFTGFRGKILLAEDNAVNQAVAVRLYKSLNVLLMSLKTVVKP